MARVRIWCNTLELFLAIQQSFDAPCWYVFTNPFTWTGYDTRSIFKRCLTGLKCEICEILSLSSRIWTQLAMSISYNDNHYTTGTSCSLLVSLFWSQVRSSHVDLTVVMNKMTAICYKKSFSNMKNRANMG